MKYFTGKGDNGSTGLIGKDRVAKSDIRLEAIGSLDELSEFIGQAKAAEKDKEFVQHLESIQRDLYSIMAELADLNHELKNNLQVDSSKVASLEEKIESIGESIKMPSGFILPGATTNAALYGICRVVTRRAERRVVELDLGGPLDNRFIMPYLNRLSSLFYILEIRGSIKNDLHQITYAKE
jgi:cob(I)alamin adenosyltransferase